MSQIIDFNRMVGGARFALGDGAKDTDGKGILSFSANDLFEKSDATAPSKSTAREIAALIGRGAAYLEGSRHNNSSVAKRDRKIGIKSLATQIRDKFEKSGVPIQRFIDLFNNSFNDIIKNLLLSRASFEQALKGQES